MNEYSLAKVQFLRNKNAQNIGGFKKMC